MVIWALGHPVGESAINPGLDIQIYFPEIRIGNRNWLARIGAPSSSFLFEDTAAGEVDTVDTVQRQNAQPRCGRRFLLNFKGFSPYQAIPARSANAQRVGNGPDDTPPLLLSQQAMQALRAEHQRAARLWGNHG